MKGKVVVVGSFMMDLVVKAERRPKTGETLVGESFGMYIGGKGNNQAIAAARFGCQVHMVGKLGQDSFANQFLDNHKLEGINSDFIIQDPNVGTGVANPFIDANADNSIIIIPRANMTLTPNAVSLAEKPIAEADVLLLQLEIPINASKRAAEIAQANGTIVILNPAPAQEIPDDFIQLADILTPNEVETEMLTRISVTHEKRVEKVLIALDQEIQQKTMFTIKNIDQLIDKEKNLLAETQATHREESDLLGQSIKISGFN